ncbi:MAG: hypothetical protein ABJO28_07010 [Maribacter dokdonensis]|uniref:Uncharacterized protein n=1 Tax=Maribacter dokdonensis TaxID=320912 RepID=A0A1H4JBZ3_9FLAO|nr:MULTISPECIES: hypothetical protein [Maribacter]HAF77807.1 hypothetical protein [Maribacter sp.]APA63484.1 hypothetical protein YQ22_03625 [Maribacter sp. 1_2014MBL_MicDiv]KSA11663.1 hypothetical protein I600_3682 [Maribacter dokdonensis DSW-8]MBU2899482.1 hypothetical protein [Maribacter dokdonensis]MDP2527691.1 hypothetical protein [Maribacter dokdonensis]|tara:strand:+ start:34 stop:231 length:198 start_codon:yes stop_codon:yes gene_type:complete
MLEQDNNPFKNLQGDLKDVPPELRKKVMDDVAAAKLVMELTNLFTGNFASIIEGMLKTNSKPNQK